MNPRILIVDDSIIVRQQLANTLAQAGYEVTEASNGEDGLRKIESCGEFTLAICDLNMPILDGLGMLARLNAKGLTARMRVLILTSEAQPNLMARARELGATGWIIKPVTMEALLRIVSRLVASTP